ncbi:hypothetical protein K438DRAFT_2011298 [Mycena galopus ATCC 62051]|nr:hypothetical protein K438DRAFT_2011298 [Mycena galopus ATCC 62051]
MWSLKAPYRTNMQMRDVMHRFVLPTVSSVVALTFPMHGTEVMPPMLPVEECLCLGAGSNGSGSAADVLRNELIAIGPHKLTATNLAKLPCGLAMPTPRGLMGSGQEARQVIADFEEQLYWRATVVDKQSPQVICSPI